MKKRNWIILGCLFVAALSIGVVLYFQGGRDHDSVGDVPGHYIGETDEEEEVDIKKDLASRTVERQKGDIIWTVSDDVHVREKYLKLFNQKLKQDGYGFQLKFQYLDEENYNDEVREVLKNGDTDIALGGQDDEYTNVVAKVCRDGLLMNIGKYLESKKCKPLLEEYEEPLWKSVSVDGKIYTIPNGIYDDGRFCVVFNHKYVNRKKIKDFGGDITELGTFLTKDMKKNSEKEKLLFTWSSSDLASVLGYYGMYGAFFEADSGKICAPFDCEKLRKFLSMLHDFHQAGCIPEECSLRSEGSNEKITDMIKNRDFGILLTKRSDAIKALGDDVTVVDLDFTPNFARVGGTNGICAKSQKAKEAMQLLTLLHTEDEYAHLLLYGKEGKDYTVENGRIVSNKKADTWTVDSLGLFRSSYPDEEELVYSGNIRQEKRKIYRSSHCKTSKAAGFQIDESAFSEKELNDSDTWESYFDIWKEKDFDTEYQKASRETGKVDKNIRRKLEKQWKEWEQVR